jgi:hypothetical protein
MTVLSNIKQRGIKPMTIKIEIPSTSEHKELARLIGEALAQYGGAKTGRKVTTEIVGDVSCTIDEPIKNEDNEPEQRPDLAQLAADGAQAPEGVELDSDGLPHDTRIHSQPAKTNADGTWKARRIPKDMDKDEWEVYQEEVKAELRQALSGEPIVEDVPPPATEGVTPPAATEDVTPPPAATEDVTPPPAATEGVTPPPAATEDVTPPPAATEDVTPPPAATEDVTPPPAATEDVTPPPAATDRTFAELMKLITSNKEALGGTDSIANVTKVLNNHGVKALPLLNSTRPDLIPVVYAELEVMING